MTRAVYVGPDLGGGVAQIAAVREPLRCAGLVVVNAISYDSWPSPSVKAIRAAGQVVRRLPKAVIRPVIEGFVLVGHDQLGRARESARLHWEPYAAHDGAAAFVRQVDSLRTADTAEIADQLPTLRVPARAVWGTSDAFQKLHFGERLARDLHTSIVRVNRARHFVPEDHPDVVAGALAEVVADVDTPN